MKHDITSHILYQIWQSCLPFFFADESYSITENREQKKIRALNRASKQAELKRLRIAQEIQREQEEIEVKLKELEERGVQVERELRGESQYLEK